MKRNKKTYCLMFGFQKDDIDNVGFLGKDLQIVEDECDAKQFFAKNYKHSNEFASPEKWLEFINSDDDLNHGFVFHLLKRTST